MATKKECVDRVSREYGDRDFARRAGETAEKRDFKGYELVIEEGKRLFMKDLETEVNE